jgi:hypothetical protein
MARKTISVGVISKFDLLRSPKGHPDTISGCGAHRDLKRDKKIRREESKRECRLD